MSIERRNFPQFFITAPSPCPYLEGKFERKVFTHLVSSNARALHNSLSQGGFRRSQNIAYRPSCEGCNACVSVRVPVDRFQPSKSQRRIIKKNADLVAIRQQTKTTVDQYALFRTYIDQRHLDGGMSDMTVLDFSAMVEESFVDTRMSEYRPRSPLSPFGAPDRNSPLLAAALVDELDDGLSMIYSFFDPAEATRSLGTYMILEHIQRAKEMGLPYLYLGYWVDGSPKMDYKSKFLPQERLGANGWELIS